MKKILFILSTFFSAFIYAENLTLEVLTEEAYPLQFSQHGKIQGSATAIVEKILKHAGINYQIKIQPWARIYNTALHKKKCPNFLYCSY